MTNRIFQENKNELKTYQKFIIFFIALNHHKNVGLQKVDF